MQLAQVWKDRANACETDDANQDGAGLPIWEQNSKVSNNLLIILNSYFAITFRNNSSYVRAIFQVTKFNVLTAPMDRA